MTPEGTGFMGNVVLIFEKHKILQVALLIYFISSQQHHCSCTVKSTHVLCTWKNAGLNPHTHSGSLIQERMTNAVTALNIDIEMSQAGNLHQLQWS